MSRPAGARAAYESWHDRLAVDTAADTPWHDLVRAHLVPARDLAGRRVLEVACGRGGFAVWLAAHPAAPRLVAGSDFAHSAVAMARDHARAAGTAVAAWHVADAQCLPHPDGSVDTVISCETIEHVPDPAQMARELARVLRPGGRLFLTTPNYLGGYGLYRWYRGLTGRPYTEEGQPINQVTLLPRTRRWLRQAGLRIVRTDGVGHYLFVPGRAPRRLHWLDRLRVLTRWTAVHSFVLAEKP